MEVPLQDDNLEVCPDKNIKKKYLLKEYQCMESAELYDFNGRSNR